MRLKNETNPSWWFLFEHWKHQESNARNKTKNVLSEVTSSLVNFMIENLMEDIEPLVRDKDAFDYVVEPY